MPIVRYQSLAPRLAIFMLDTSTKIYRDDDPDELEKSIPPEAFHRHVDLAIIQADKEGSSFRA